jgi:hypothetical protein
MGLIVEPSVIAYSVTSFSIPWGPSKTLLVPFALRRAFTYCVAKRDQAAESFTEIFTTGGLPLNGHCLLTFGALPSGHIRGSCVPALTVVAAVLALVGAPVVGTADVTGTAMEEFVVPDAFEVDVGARLLIVDADDVIVVVAEPTVVKGADVVDPDGAPTFGVVAGDCKPLPLEAFVVLVREGGEALVTVVVAVVGPEDTGG